jgi:hypothetical protein
MDKICFQRHRFPPDIIRHAVWLYARFTLSYRDVEDLLAERGNKDAIKNRDMVAKQMTPAQIVEAQKLAREWFSKGG